MNESTSSSKGKEIAYFLTYFFTWLSGLIVYLTKGKEDSRYKFHAAQAILLGIVSIVISIVFSLFGGAFIGGIISLFIWIYALYVGYKAYNNEDVMIPKLSDYASSWSGYNENKQSTKTEVADEKQEHESEHHKELLKTLKTRYVKGEISKKKYLLMKKEIEDEE